MTIYVDAHALPFRAMYSQTKVVNSKNTLHITTFIDRELPYIISPNSDNAIRLLPTVKNSLK